VTATSTMLVAIAAGVVGRWSHNQKAVPSGKGVIEVLFSLVLISALDQGRTAPIARGFALIFLAAVLLSDNSPLTGAALSTPGASLETAGNAFAAGSQGIEANVTNK
jgi:hypothetical protein